MLCVPGVRSCNLTVPVFVRPAPRPCAPLLFVHLLRALTRLLCTLFCPPRLCAVRTCAARHEKKISPKKKKKNSFTSVAGLPFLPVYAWVGLWTSAFLSTLALVGASNLIEFATQFTDDVFNALLSVNFIYEVGVRGGLSLPVKAGWFLMTSIPEKNFLGFFVPEFRVEPPRCNFSRGWVPMMPGVVPWWHR